MEDESSKPAPKKKYKSKRQWFKEQNEKPVTQEDVMQYALVLLERQDYTSGRLMQKLNERYRRDTQFNEAVLARLVDKKYVNDESFLKRLVASMIISRKGVNDVRNKLYRKCFIDG